MAKNILVFSWFSLVTFWAGFAWVLWMWEVEAWWLLSLFFGGIVSCLISMALVQNYAGCFPECYQVPAAAYDSSLRVELISPDGMSGEYKHFGSVDRLLIVAEHVSCGGGFTEKELTGSGRPFSKREFHELRGELISTGFAAWRRPGHPAQGIVITPAGYQALSSLLQRSTQLV